MLIKTFILIFYVAVILLLAGCSNIGYYAQSVAGGFNVLVNREPIEVVVQDENVPQHIKTKLATVLQIRKFATEALSLPDNDSYRTYVDLGRPYAVWNVFAAPEFSMEMQEWCFLFVGCVKYRGYFHEQDAIEFAEGLDSEGLDVYVSGIAAYSTIGWFDDPVMNTIINRDEIRLAGLIFHELSHQQLFIKGDTAFNEGFAVAVELEGIKRWLAQHDSLQDIEHYTQRKQRHKQFVQLISKTRNQLDHLYKSRQSSVMLRQKKNNIISQLRNEYAVLKQSWDGYEGYDNWFSKDINNAQIAAITTYRDYVPAFQALLQQQGGDLAAFYQVVAEIGDMPAEQRTARIHQLIPVSSPP
ncbi:MAG: aminopeptidase [Gammaproteobacteria bacterium]|nr:aminopeptidase [Gammaproteobacteria bacterium]